MAYGIELQRELEDDGHNTCVFLSLHAWVRLLLLLAPLLPWTCSAFQLASCSDT